jgi:hypothetical protein
MDGPRTLALGSILVACTLLGACTGDSSPSDGSSSAPAGSGGGAAQVDMTGAMVVPKGPVPAPAVPKVLKTSTSPEKAVGQVVRALGSSDADRRLAGMLSAAAWIDLPVVEAPGTSVNGTDDRIGLPWVSVSTLPAASPGFSETLADAVRTYTLTGEGDPPAADPALAASVLDELRAGLTAKDSGVRFFSHLVDSTSGRLGGAGLEVGTADEVRVDQAVIDLLMGRVIRSFLAEVASPEGYQPGRGASGGVQAAGASAPTDCSDDSASGWAVWLASKALGGADAKKLLGESAAFDGLTKKLVDALAGARYIPSGAVSVAEKVAAAAGPVTAALSALNYSAELAMISVDGELTPEPLERNKRKAQGDGKTGQAVFTISFKGPDQLEGTVKQAANCLLALGAALGNNTFIPKAGPQPGLSVELVGQKGFSSSLVTAGTLVLFGPSEVHLKQDTSSTGQVKVGVQGRQQTRDYPDSASPVKKTFSIEVKSSLEPLDGNSVGKTFLDSLICVGAGKFACADAFTDIAKTAQYSLGAQEFNLTDWATGWVIDAKIPVKGGVMTVKGVSCTSERGPWKITYTVPTGGLILKGALQTTFPEGEMAAPVTGTQTLEVPGTGKLSEEFESTAELLESEDGYEIETTGGIFKGEVMAYGVGKRKVSGRGPERVTFPVRPAGTECD